MEEATNRVRQRIKTKAAVIMQGSDLSGMLELMGAAKDSAAAGAAMRAIMAQRMSECAIGAMKEARKHRMRVGAAAIIIAANS